MPKSSTRTAEQSLSEIVTLLQGIVARDLARSGVTQEAIGKRLKIAKADVGPMVKGIKKVK